jgi:quinol monooxygenase YgiN
MLALIVEFRIKPEFVRGFAVAIEENARLSRDIEPGCRQFDVCRDAGEPGLFFLYELYDDEAAIQAHLRSPHFMQMDAATAGWVESKMVRKLQRTMP